MTKSFGASLSHIIVAYRFQSYRHLVLRVSRTSQWLAMVLPHGVYWGVAAVVCYLSPRLTRYLANDTPLIVVLSTLGPGFATFLTIVEYKLQKKQNKINDPLEKRSDKENRGSSSTKATPRNKRSHERPTPLMARTNTPTISRRPRRSLGSIAGTPLRAHRHGNGDLDDIKADLSYYKKYWTVYAAYAMAVKIMYQVPIVSRILFRTAFLKQMGQQLQLLAILWVYIMPYLIVVNSDVNAANSSLPIPMLYKYLRPRLHQVLDRLALVSRTTWNERVVSISSSGLRVVRMMGLISESTKNRVIEGLTSHGPALVLPLCTLFLFPSVLTQVAIIVAQYLLPLQLDTPASSMMPFLQYWVVHILIQFVIAPFEGLLSWIPHVQLLLYICISIPSVCNSWFDIVHEECIDWGLLRPCDGGHQQEGQPTPRLEADKTRLGRAWLWLLEYLPRHREEEENLDSSNAAEEDDIRSDDDMQSADDQEEDDDDDDFVMYEQDVDHDALHHRSPPPTRRGRVRNTSNS